MKRSGRYTSFAKRRMRTGICFVMPFVVGAVVFVLIPFFQAIYFSLCDLKLTADGYTLNFVGLANYNQAFAVDPNFRKELLSSVGNMLVNVPLTVLFAFFMASLLNQKFIGRSVARVILFVPVIISSGIVTNLMAGDLMNNLLQSADKTNDSLAAGGGMATAFVEMMNQMSMDSRIVNFIVEAVGRLSDIITMAAVPTVIFLAGLQAISESVYEAAYMEGATGWEVFWKISFPMVSPLILVTVVYSIVDSFTNISNTVINTIHTTSFTSMKFGLGAAMAIAYMAIILVLLAIIYKIIARYVSYQN